jgi:hypothetical protein
MNTKMVAAISADIPPVIIRSSKADSIGAIIRQGSQSGIRKEKHDEMRVESAVGAGKSSW